MVTNTSDEQPLETRIGHEHRWLGFLSGTGSDRGEGRFQDDGMSMRRDAARISP